MLHACAARFDVTGNLEKFCELNKAFVSRYLRRADATANISSLDTDVRLFSWPR